MYNQTTGDFSFGISDDFQASLGLTELFGALARIQYQLVGVPRSKATTGWSMSVNAELGYDTSSKDGDQSSTFGPGGYKCSSRTTMSYAGGGLSIGYRANSKFMAFIGSNVNKFQAKTTIDQEPGISNVGGIYEQKNEGQSQATGLGFVLGAGGVRLIPVVQLTDYKLDQSDSIKGFWCGLSLVMGD